MGNVRFDGLICSLRHRVRSYGIVLHPLVDPTVPLRDHPGRFLILLRRLVDDLVVGVIILRKKSANLLKKCMSYSLSSQYYLATTLIVFNFLFY